MPIVAIEGPDRAGKSTLFTALKATGIKARFLPQVKFAASSVVDLERHSLDMWTALYDPEELYICDRPCFVSSQIYSRLYGRPIPDVSMWLNEVYVCYLEVDHRELVRRHEATDDHVGQLDVLRVLALYEEELRRWKTVRLSTVEEVVSWIARSF